MEQNIKREPLGKDCYLYVSPHHTFGTDAVVLSNFAKPKQKDRLIDLGTGCGIIPFIILRDYNLPSAIGIDISKEATDLCEKTITERNIKNFTALNSDLNDLKGKIEFGAATLITCNPPYKANGAGLKNPDSVEMVARHEVACTLDDIIAVSSKLLQTSGRLCLCHRPERLSELMCTMEKYKIEPKRLRLVCQRKGEEPWLVLVEGRKSGNRGMRIEPTLYVEENGEFSPEMIEIYGSYKEAYL